MAESATVRTSVSIDVGPKGVKFTFEGLDKDLAELIVSAGEFVVDTTIDSYKTFDSNNVVVKSKKVLQFVEDLETETP